MPAAPTDAGYSFNGWFTAPSGGTALTSPYTLTASTTLYAQWNANPKITITFNSEGGSAVSAVTGLEGTTITLPAAPTYTGYTFNGWFTAPSGGTALDLALHPDGLHHPLRPVERQPCRPQSRTRRPVEDSERGPGVRLHLRGQREPDAHVRPGVWGAVVALDQQHAPAC